jgi:ABC-type methionine transport system ATPase subunit
LRDFVVIGAKVSEQLCRLVYPPDLVDHPVLYNMSKNFGVQVDIRRATLTADRGWVIIQIKGSQDDLEKALAWVKEQGVRVELLSSEN